MGCGRCKLQTEKKKMVSLKELSTYQESLRTPKTIAFYDFVFGKNPNIPSGVLGNSDKNFFDLLLAIVAKDKDAFIKTYRDYEKRTPNSSAPFIHDNFLILVLIFGIQIFEINKTWIHSVINVRHREEITITFENILNDNLFSKSNVPEIILFYLRFLENDGWNDNLLNNCYASVESSSEWIDKKDDFRLILLYKGFRDVIFLKNVDNNSELIELKHFEKMFLKRSKYFTWLLYTGLVGLVVFGLYKLLQEISPENKKILENILFSVSIIGVSISFIFKPIREKIEKGVQRYFGYKKPEEK